MHAAISQLPQASLDTLENSVRPKFNAYFGFTRSLTRSVSVANYFIYPEDSILTDLTVLAALFAETYEAFGRHARPQFAGALASDSDLREDFRRIVQGDRGKNESDGSFWMFNSTRGTGSVPTADAVSVHLETLLQTLRNGFQHFHWRYDDLSALDYWSAQHWSTAGADAAFGLENRPQNNYIAYIADGQGWDANRFWQLNDLRVLVTPYTVLRYNLHLSLNQILNATRVDVFGRAV